MTENTNNFSSQSSPMVLRISSFKKTGEKTVGVTGGFPAEMSGETYMVKAFKNGNLTDEEFKKRKEDFKGPCISSSVTLLLKLLSRHYDSGIRRYAELTHQAIAQNIIKDDLNLAECIREYVAAIIHKALLGEDAPDIFLVIDDRGEGKIYLASKFIPNFTTVLDHLKKGTEDQYTTASGYERILAAQLLAGESDIIQPGNYGVVKVGSENAHFAKIDHGKTGCIRRYKALEQAEHLSNVRGIGIKISASKLKSELKKQAKILRKNSKQIEAQIRERVKELEKNLDHSNTFVLRTVDELSPFSQLTMTSFQYNKQKGKFVSDKGETLEDYFVAEFRRYKDRAATFDASINSAIKSGFVMVVSAGGVFSAKFFETEIVEKLGEKPQQAILGVSIALLCLSTVFALVFLHSDRKVKKALEGGFDTKLIEDAKAQIQAVGCNVRL